MNYYKAKPIADRIVELLGPHCVPGRLHIAGSIRRQKVEVKDLEIVCEAKREFVASDLFGNGVMVIVPGFIETINLIAKEIVKGKPDGRQMQIILKGPDKFTLDLFLPQPEDYFRQYAIRTGNAEYAASVIANGWRNIGWCGTTNAGLRQQKFCVQRPSGWFCLNLESPTPTAWQSEEEFFNWIGVPFQDPRDRNL